MQHKLRAVQLTNAIGDRLYFETAINALITLCIDANEAHDAQQLFRAVTLQQVRDAILRTHPELRE